LGDEDAGDLRQAGLDDEHGSAHQREEARHFADMCTLRYAVEVKQDFARDGEERGVEQEGVEGEEWKSELVTRDKVSHHLCDGFGERRWQRKSERGPGDVEVWREADHRGHLPDAVAVGRGAPVHDHFLCLRRPAAGALQGSAEGICFAEG